MEPNEHLIQPKSTYSLASLVCMHKPRSNGRNFGTIIEAGLVFRPANKSNPCIVAISFSHKVIEQAALKIGDYVEVYVGENTIAINSTTNEQIGYRITSPTPKNLRVYIRMKLTPEFEKQFGFPYSKTQDCRLSRPVSLIGQNIVTEAGRIFFSV